jgi:hypothetical protein
MKTKVDYFPHVTHLEKTIAILEAHWGNDGYAFWFKLLEMLGDSDEFACRCDNSSEWEYLLSRTRVSEAVAVAILDKLAGIGAIDADLWANRIIWSKPFIQNLTPVFERRKCELPHKPDFCCENPGNAGIISTKTDKEKESREEDSKAEKSTVEKESESAAVPGRTMAWPSARRPGVVRQADTVYLKPAERDRLAANYGEDGAARIIALLDAYKTNHSKKGREYRDDYKVIQTWVINRYREERGNSGLSPGGSRTFMDRLADMVQEDET